MYKSFPIFKRESDDTITAVTDPVAVELWTTGTGAAKVAELGDGIINNNDGTYKIDISNLDSGVYDIKVDLGSGLSVQDEVGNIRIEGNDVLTQAMVDDTTIEINNDSKLAIKVVGKDQIGENVAGDGLKQNTDNSISPDVDDSTIQVNADGKVAIKKIVKNLFDSGVAGDGVGIDENGALYVDVTGLIDDSAGAGDGNYAWSADKLYDLIGDVSKFDTYDYLDEKKPLVHNIIQALKYAKDSLKPDDGGSSSTSGLDEVIAYADFSKSGSLPEYSESGTSYVEQLRFSFSRLSRSTLFFKLKGYTDGSGGHSGGTMRVQVYIGGEVVSESNLSVPPGEDYTNLAIEVNLDYIATDERYIAVVSLQNSSDGTAAKIKELVAYVT